jgi:hypothetical protein
MLMIITYTNGVCGTIGNEKRMDRKINRLWCDIHEKWGYLTRKNAKRVARQHHDEHKAVYPCQVTNSYWHVGGLDHNVIAGVISREERYGDTYE